MGSADVFSGTRAVLIQMPQPSPISPTALLSPAPPTSVSARRQPASRRSRMAFLNFTCSSGAPICTAASSIAEPAELADAPWIPSLPVRPPMRTTRSPGRGTPRAAADVGRSPILPPSANGLAR